MNNLHKLIMLQRRIIRMIMSAKQIYITEPLFLKLGKLKLYKLYILV